MRTELLATCQMVERNNGIVRALFTCTQKSQEETVLVNLSKDRGLPRQGRNYRLVLEETRLHENGK